MNPVAKRLRSGDTLFGWASLAATAAVEIDRLEAELEQLRAELERLRAELDMVSK